MIPRPTIKLFLITSLISLASCSDSIVDIPDVTFTCSTAHCAAATPGVPKAAAYWSLTACTNTTDIVENSNFKAAMSYSTSQVTCNNTTCIGDVAVPVWTNRLSTIVTQLAGSIYSLCVFIDLDGDDEFDETTDDVGTLSLVLSSTSGTQNVTSFATIAAD